MDSNKSIAGGYHNYDDFPMLDSLQKSSIDA